MRLKLFIGAFAALTLSVTVSAQSKGGGGATAGAPVNPNAEMTSGVGKYANFDRELSRQRGGIYFAGKVAIDNGALPWDPIPVTVTCNGTVRYDTQTDAKSTFTIQSTPASSEVAPQFTDTRHVTAAQLAGCQVQASLAGFRSSVLTIANNNIMDNPDIGTITLHLDEHAAGFAVSPTTTSAAPEALKKFAKARSEWMDKNPGGAERDLEKTVQIDPKFAEAWYQLGKLQQAAKPQDALVSYQKAVAADPQFTPPYQYIAELAASQQKWHDVIDATDKALKLDPAGTPQIWYYNAVGNYNGGDKSVAEESAKKSLAMDPQHVAPNTEQLLAVMLAGQGDYVAALQHLRSCLAYTAPGANADLMKQQIAQLEKMVPAGK